VSNQGIPHAKNKETIPQAKITNRKKRLENIRGVFDVILCSPFFDG
jgi:hypothetical protein